MSAYDELICVMRQQGTAGSPGGYAFRNHDRPDEL